MDQTIQRPLKNNIHGIYLDSKNFEFKETSLFEVGLLNFFYNISQKNSLKFLSNILFSKIFRKVTNYESFLNTEGFFSFSFEPLLSKRVVANGIMIKKKFIAACLGFLRALSSALLLLRNKCLK